MLRLAAEHFGGRDLDEIRNGDFSLKDKKNVFDYFTLLSCLQLPLKPWKDTSDP